MPPYIARLKLIAIFAPVAVVAVATFLMRGPIHEELHDFPGFIYLVAVLSGILIALTAVVFAIIERVERRLIEQNERLSIINDVVAAAELELDSLLDVALPKILRVAGANGGLVCLAHRHGLVAVPWHNGVGDELAERFQELGGPEAARQAADLAAAAGFPSALAVPLVSAERGLLVAVASRRDAFSQRTAELLHEIAAQLALAVRNAMLYREAQQRSRELQAVLTVAEASRSQPGLDEALDDALDAAISVTSADAAELWLATDRGELVLARHRGSGPDAFFEQTSLVLGESLPGTAAQSARPVVVHDLGGNERTAGHGVQPPAFESLGAFPLIRHGSTLGVLAVAARTRGAFSDPAERRLLEGVGEQLALAIENARLHERVLDAAVLEERERLARELHDGLAQVLGYINTQTLAVKQLLRAGRAAEAGAELEAMRRAARDVYGDVREAILGLRLTIPGGLVTSLEQYVDAYEGMRGSTVRLEAHDGVRDIQLAPETEIQLLRIVQEAVANARKHADATTTTIRLSAEHGELMIEVSDDGRGFDLDRPPQRRWPQFGLQTMRERAQAIGAAFELRSQPGAGTCVAVMLPVSVEERDASPAR